MSGSVHSPSNAPVVSWGGVGGVSSFRSDWTNGNQTHSELIEVADCTMQMPTTTSFPLGPMQGKTCVQSWITQHGGGGEFYARTLEAILLLNFQIPMDTALSLT